MKTLWDALEAAAAKWPDKPFLCIPARPGRGYLEEGAEWTFSEVLAEASALADQYAAAGWGPGHRVALALDNHPAHFLHYFALNRVGASQVPVNPYYLRGELEYLFEHSEAAMTVAAPWNVEKLSQAGAPGVTPMEGWSPAPAPDVSPVATLRCQAEIAVIYTSGTTGRPKGCVLSNDYALAVGAWYRDIGGALTLQEAQERVYVPLPVFHVNGGINTPAAMLLTGNCLIMPDRFHADTWWDDIAATQATAMHYLGIIPPALMATPASDRDRSHGLRFGLGAGLDPALHQAFEARFGLPMVEVWGMTETGRFLAAAHEPRMTDTRAFGRATEDFEAMIADEAGTPVKDGAEGELLVRSPGADPRRHFFSEYLKNKDETDRAWAGGWFHTGDVVRRDETGMLHFVERAKNIIRRSGENISAAEVENALIEHPSVAQVAVVSCPDEMRDEEVFACVVSAGEIAADELLAFAAERIAYYKAPGWLAVMDELPVTGTQKIQKHLIFGKGADPRKDARAVDLREVKRELKR
ncbi:MAG: AMP-binding protein [Pseudomonadota bacterium]